MNLRRNHPRPQAMTWLLLAFVALNAILLFIIFSKYTVDYPVGWDAPYYINHVRAFAEDGIVPQRYGFILGVGTIHLLTQVPIITLITWASPVLMLLTAAGVALIVYMASRRSPLAFCLAFSVTLWSSTTVQMANGTFDNAFALSVLFVTLWALFWRGPSWRRGLWTLAGATIIAHTHLETFIFLALITVAYHLLLIHHYRSVRIWWKQELDVIVAAVGGGLAALLYWAPALNTIFSFYTTPAGVGGNASIPYVRSTDWGAVLNYLRTGLNDASTLVLALTALAVLGYRSWRRGEQLTNLLLAYIVAGYGILLYAVLRGSIPINRALLIIPVSAMVAFGVYCVLHIIRRWPIAVTLLFVTWVYLVLANPATTVAILRRTNPSISPTALASYRSLATYVYRHQITSYIVVSDVPPHERAASAYYSLWTNWLVATRPAGYSPDQVCIYLGTLDRYRRDEPTTRQSGGEYNSTSIEGQRCRTELEGKSPVPPAVFVISSLYPGTKAPTTKGSTIVEPIGPSLYRVTFGTELP